MTNSLIEMYFKGRSITAASPGFLAYLANLECVRRVAPEVAKSIVQELADQRRNIKMIASENFSSLATQCAMANLFTDKYAEGIPHHRFYAGCDNVDSIEDLANHRARELFGAAHAYAQPHSGADANLVAFWAILRARVELAEIAKAMGKDNIEEIVPADWYKLSHDQWRSVRQALGNQRLLGMDLASGGHLTHGYRLNASGKMFDAYGYTVDRNTFLLDYDAIERQAIDVKPLILLAGFSAYSRNINYARMRAIADRVGAVFMVDMAHFAGLVAGKVLQGEFNPVPFAPPGHNDNAQDAAWAAGRPGALRCRSQRPRRPRLPARARRPLASRHGGQGRCLYRSTAPGILVLRPSDRGQRPRPGRSIHAPGTQRAHRRD